MPVAYPAKQERDGFVRRTKTEGVILQQVLSIATATNDGGREAEQKRNDRLATPI